MSAQNTSEKFTRPFAVLSVLFFIFGLITSLNDILVPHLKDVFTLTYMQASLVQFCFFFAYFVASVPSGYIAKRVGYKTGIIIGLLTAGIGCLLFYPAASIKSYPFFLLALFVLACGITMLQVVCNAFVTVLGRPETASSRLTLAQAFNSVGTAIGPVVGGLVILSVVTESVSSMSPEALAQYTSQQAEAVQLPYLALTLFLVLLAVIVTRLRLPDPLVNEAPSDVPHTKKQVHYQQHDSVWGYRHLVLGAVGIFAYVGAEVSIGSYLVSLMGMPQVAGLEAKVASHYLALYWSGAMVGRFIGAYVLRKMKPGYVLAFNALMSALLIAVAVVSSGPVAMWALIAIGFFNSIMFPTIFALAVEGLGKLTSAGSGVLAMAIVGGAIVPVVQGFFADHIGLLTSFLVPLVCYLYIAFYGVKGHYADFVEDQDLNTGHAEQKA